MNTKTRLKLSTIDSTNKFDGQYLRLPLNIIKENLDMAEHELTEFEAFVQIMVHTKYADRTEKVGTEERICHRGEAFHSLEHWSKCFNWNKSRTRRFLMELAGRGFIELESLQHTTRLRVVHYDFYVGRSVPEGKNKYPADFEAFWETYHRTTGLQTTDKEAAYRSWRKLSTAERDKAVSNTGNYFYSLSKSTYCVKALTYLHNKKFNDQFYY
jgi:hypothetical protein